jgi:hypothetical protein
MRLAGNALWLTALLVLAFTPILDYAVSIAPVPWLLPPVQGLLIGFVLWNLRTTLRHEARIPAREWSPTPLALLGVGLALGVWWDPYAWLDQLGTLLAGGGLLEAGIVRLARGGLTLGAFLIFWRGLRPSQNHVARHQRKHARKAQKKDKARAPRAEGAAPTTEPELPAHDSP